MAAIAPVAGRLVDRTGPRFTLNLGMGSPGIGCALVATMNSKLMFVIGCAGFFGVGFAIVATHVVATAVTRSFSAQRSLATGIATSGSTGGQFLIVPLIAALLAFASWQGSFGAPALGSLTLIPCIRVMLRGGNKAVPADASHQLSQRMAKDFGHIIRKPAFHALFWSYVICGFTSTGAIETNLLPYAAFCGFPPIPSATAYGRLSLINLMGMVGAGYLSNRVNRAPHEFRACTGPALRQAHGGPPPDAIVIVSQTYI